MEPSLTIKELPTDGFASFGLFSGKNIVGHIELILADDGVVCVSRVEVSKDAGAFGFVRLIKKALRLVRNYKQPKLRCYVNSEDQRLIDIYTRFGGKTVQTVVVIEAEVERHGSNLSRSNSTQPNKREG